MKQLILVSLLLISASSIRAQTLHFQGGASSANMRAKDQESFFALYGFTYGALATFPVTDYLAFQSGLQKTTKGARIRYATIRGGWAEPVKIRGYSRLHQVELPFRILLGDLKDGTRPHAIIGMYAGVGIQGSTSISEVGIFETTKNTQDLRIGSDEDDHMQKFDYGWTLGSGWNFPRFHIQLTYSRGRVEHYPPSSLVKSTHRVWAITAGYRLWEKK